MPYSGSKEEITAKRKVYNSKHKDKILEYQQNYRLTNANLLSEKTMNWQRENPEEYKEKNRFWNSENKGSKKSAVMKNEYGITLEEYNVMFEQQGGKCKICGVHQANLKKALHIDHCHSKLHVRGLLCQHCNSAIGFFRDNIEVMKTAIKYLQGEL